MKDAKPLLEVRDLHIRFGEGESSLDAVSGASLEIASGEIVGIIGESGSGKTTIAQGLLGLIRGGPGIWQGEAEFEGNPLLPKAEKFVRRNKNLIRKRLSAYQRSHLKLVKPLLGVSISSIFQEPRAALNPYFTVGEHLLEAIKRRPGVASNNNESRKESYKAYGFKLLHDVGLTEAERLWSLYPHEISGGMAQRVMVSMALAPKPKLLIADEPSTALDVTTQAKLLELLLRLREEHDLAILLISHDMGVIQATTDRIYVMHRGRIVEKGSTSSVMQRARHPYTAGLLQAFEEFGHNQFAQPTESNTTGCLYRSTCQAFLNRLEKDQRRKCENHNPSGTNSEDGQAWALCHFPEISKKIFSNTTAQIHKGSKDFEKEREEEPEDLKSAQLNKNESAPRNSIDYPTESASDKTIDKATDIYQTENPILEIKKLRKSFGKAKKKFIALSGIDLQIEKGSCYGLVGESGSGKSTLALTALMLQSADSGEVFFQKRDLEKLSKEELRQVRKDLRMLFQHADAVLNSGMTIRQILLEGLENEKQLDKSGRQARLSEIIESVRLEERHLSRYPANLSSGEKQRVAIARALITKPKFLVCDEPVASLDLSIQSQILWLLKSLQNQLGLSYLFISHNLAMVRLLADKIGVMYMGDLVEEAPVEAFTVAKALHPYSRLLLASSPSEDPAIAKEVLARYPDSEPLRLNEGCPFRNRCSLYLNNPLKRCEIENPSLKWVAEARVACHQVAE